MASSREATHFDVLIGRRIKAARRAAGLTQTELAKAINKTFQQVQKYETGRNRVSAGALFEISVRLKKPVEWFFEDCAKLAGANYQASDMVVAAQAPQKAVQSEVLLTP